MKKTISIFLLVFLFVQLLQAENFTNVSVPFKYVHRVKLLSNNQFFISGDSSFIDLTVDKPFLPYFGSGFYLSDDDFTTFNGPYLEGFTVLDLEFAAKKSNQVYALASKLGRTGVYESMNSGKEWGMFPKIEETSIMHKILLLPDDEKDNFIIASLNTSEGLMLSSDYFESVDIPESFQSQVFDIKFNQTSNELYFSSDNNISGKAIRLVNDSVHRDISGLENLRVLSLQPSSVNPAYIYVGVDSVNFQKVAIGKGIYMSIDTGKTWTYLTGEGYRVFDIKEHPKNPNYMAAAMGNGGVGISANFGQYFEVYKSGLPENADVRQVAIPSIPTDENGMIVYAVTLENGLFKSNRLISSVENNPTSALKIKSIYPNPISSDFSVTLENDDNSPLQIKIINQMGKVEFETELLSTQIGENVISFPKLNLNSGLYFLTIQSKSKIVNHKLLFID